MFTNARLFEKALEPLVHSALALGRAERRAWLNDLRADCPTVTHEVERLLGQLLGPMLPGGEDAAAHDVVPGSPEYFGLRC